MSSVVLPSAIDKVIESIEELSVHPNVKKFQKATYRHRNYMQFKDMTDSENQEEMDFLEHLDFLDFLDEGKSELEWYQLKLLHLLNLTTKAGLKAELKKLDEEAGVKMRIDRMLADHIRNVKEE